jgi:MYXO-CTERM domain-containing protein
MNFIEQLFAVAPDGGSGSTEVALLLAVGLIAVYVLRRRLARTPA